jgi:two-component system LytT family response regulator
MKTAPMRVIIVDDEPAARASLAVLLSSQSDVVLLASCQDGLEAVEEISRLRPDLVWLDVQMPELDGFGVLKALAAKGIPLPFFVFVTAYDHYAIRAFDNNALDYLLKPYDDARFYRSLEKVRQTLHMKGLQVLTSQLENLIRTLDQTRPASPAPVAYLRKLVIKQNGRILFVPTDEIYYVESESNFVKVYTPGGMHVANYTCKQLEELLDPKQFTRIHKSFLVNIEQIHSVETHFHGDYLIKLKNGGLLKLSRNYKNKLDLILNQY